MTLTIVATSAVLPTTTATSSSAVCARTLSVFGVHSGAHQTSSLRDTRARLVPPPSLAPMPAPEWAKRWRYIISKLIGMVFQVREIYKLVMPTCPRLPLYAKIVAGFDEMRPVLFRLQQGLPPKKVPPKPPAACLHTIQAGDTVKWDTHRYGNAHGSYARCNQCEMRWKMIDGEWAEDGRAKASASSARSSASSSQASSRPSAKAGATAKSLPKAKAKASTRTPTARTHHFNIAASETVEEYFPELPMDYEEMLDSDEWSHEEEEEQDF